MYKFIAILLVVGCVVIGGCEKEETKEVPIVTEVDQVSYIIGTQMGQNLARGGAEINVDVFVRGLEDGRAGREPAISQEEGQKIMRDFQQKMMARQQAKMAEEGANNIAAGSAFLEANKAKEGVKVLPSGLQYKVLQEGSGKIPTASDKVKVHYRGTLIDGTEFDSSYKRNAPAEFGVTGVIKGWIEALQLMKEGGKWELYIPSELAYGPSGRPNIPPSSTLVFEVELIEIVK